MRVLLRPDLACPNYLALWGADAVRITTRLDRIRKTASEIITHLDGKARE